MNMEHAIPLPKHIGYFAKQIERADGRLAAAGVDLVFSVSECISKGAPDWVSAWKHNSQWAFDTEDLAWSVVPGGRSNTQFHVLALAVCPVAFHNCAERSIRWQALSGAIPPPPRFERLGWDIVSGEPEGGPFSCSPLSCNYGAGDFTVNRYCLVDKMERAVEIARVFANPDRGYEPGPYFVVEVRSNLAAFQGEGR